ncbi:aminotransferase class IV, partial [Alcanivorax sp.]|uniref:aminotransferase class IV n=1 Tax=Alcanivorax sp. TaxID=1872427 RepID=UPI00258968D1
MKAICWKNGKVMEANEATVSVFDHGFLYGDGVFEGIRFYHGSAFRLEAHLKRLADSARAIALHVPYTEDELANAVRECIAALGEEHGHIRLMVTR